MDSQPEKQSESQQRLSKLLADIFQSYQTEERKQELQTTFPNLPPDHVADRLITIASRKAAAVGGGTGVVTTAAFLSTFASGGAGATLLLGTIGAEMLYLVRLQIELVLDISLLYGIEIEEHPQLPVLLGAGNISIEALEVALKNPTLVLLARIMAHTFPRKWVMKSFLPILPIVVGGGYNYVTVKALGEFAKSYLEEKGKANEEC